MRHYLVFSLIVFMTVISIHTTSSASPEVSKLLRQCQKHMQANRLTSGRGGTALGCYKEVLEKEPGNSKALEGLAEIEARYAGWAKRALDRGQKNKVERYLASLRLVNPESPKLAELEKLLHPQSPVSTDSSSPEKKAESTDSPEKKAEPVTNKDTSQAPPTEEQKEEEEEKEALPKKAQIVDVGQIYELINTTDCLIWPSLDKQKKGGKNGWGSFYPKKGDTGIIVEEIKHCHFEDKVVYILEIGEYYVPISSVGVKIFSEEKSTETSE